MSSEEQRYADPREEKYWRILLTDGIPERLPYNDKNHRKDGISDERRDVIEDAYRQEMANRNRPKTGE